MRKNILRLVATASGLLLATGGLATSATAAGSGGAGSSVGAAVQSCHGSAKHYAKPSESNFYPSVSGYLKATGNCADINIKPNTNRYIAVCFAKSSGGVKCQSGYRHAKKGRWNVIATNVKKGTKFAFVFRNQAKFTGSWAA